MHIVASRRHLPAIRIYNSSLSLFSSPFSSLSLSLSPLFISSSPSLHLFIVVISLYTFPFPLSLPPSLSPSKLLSTQLTGSVASAQAIPNGLELVVVSLTTSINKRQTSTTTSVIVVSWKGSSARTCLWRQRTGVYACPQGTRNESRGRTKTVKGWGE